LVFVAFLTHGASFYQEHFSSVAWVHRMKLFEVRFRASRLSKTTKVDTMKRLPKGLQLFTFYITALWHLYLRPNPLQRMPCTIYHYTFPYFCI